MAVKVIQIVVIAAAIVATLTEPPVRIDEQHLRVRESEGIGNGWQDSVPGLPGKDYPNLSSIPKTSFSCVGKRPGGYYADVETRCQVFHVCNTEGTKSSFLCPSGSIFNQRHFVCDWWYDFECESAPDLYSLNDALDEHESTSEQSESDRYSPNAPLPYNSISASHNDLSLASSGYPNNIRDQANLIYEDYASDKIIEADGNLKPQKPTPGGSTDSSTGSYVLSNSDNHSDGFSRKSEISPGATQSDARSRNSYDNRSNNFSRRPSPLSDNVPRGFSSTHAEDLKRNSNGPGFFVNNGLFEEREKHHESSNVLLRESSHIIDKQYINEATKIVEKNRTSNADMDNKSKNHVRYGIYYQNPEKYPLPQENNNYLINDSKKLEESNDKNEIHSNYQYSSNGTFGNYKNLEMVEPRARTTAKYENYFEQSESVESSSNTSGSYDFTEEPYNRVLDYGTYAATTSRVIASAPSEDEVDREWQRVVDSTELKRNSAQRTSYDYESSASYFIREESGHPWREGATTSSSGLSSPPYAPEVPESGYSNYDSSTLSRPGEATTPTANQRPKFLGRRPTGGLLSGAGNGLPGASKVLAGSVNVTGKPDEHTGSTGGPSGNEAWANRDEYHQGNKLNEFAEAGAYWNK